MTDLEIAAPVNGQLAFGDEHRRLISDVIAPGASGPEIETFLHVCAHVQLDPLRNQIWLVPRWDSKLRREVFRPQTGIDGMRLIAQRTGLYGGTLPPEWCGPDGRWVDVWLDKDTPPAAARVQVLRKDWDQPSVGVTTWDQFAVTYYDKKAQVHKVAPMWRQMPAHMLAKTAEALALRKAFPAEMSGVYTDDELPAETVEVARVGPEPQHDDGEAAAVKALFDKFLPLVPALGDVDRFKAEVTASAAEAGLGEISEFTISAMTPAQAEHMLDEAKRRIAASSGEAIEGVDDTDGAVSMATLRLYCQSIGVKASRSRADTLQGVADHHGCTVEEAEAHVADWGQQ